MQIRKQVGDMQQKSAYESFMNTQVRSETKLFVAALVQGILGACLFVACNPNTNVFLDDEGTANTTDMQSSVGPCEAERVRCSANHDATEICRGGAWQTLSTCDPAIGAICLGNTCLSECDRVGRGNVGCSFYPANLWSTSLLGDLGIVVTNTSATLTAVVTLEDSNGPVQSPITIPPANQQSGGVGIFRLDHFLNKLSETEQARKGFHLSSTIPVAVYQFHPIDAASIHSGSATLLLPEQVMAKDYFVMSYKYNSNLPTFPPQGQGFLAVMGITDNTKVDISVPVDTKGGAGVPAIRGGRSLSRTLNRMEVLEIIQVNSQEDISGATVHSSAPVVVYGGAGGVTIPLLAVGGNHLGVQMFPLETWGKKYLAAKVKPRNQADVDYYRIVSSVDNTQIKLTGGSGLPTSIPLQRRGQFFEFSTSSNFLIEANQPIMAFQYMQAWGNLFGPYDPIEFPDGPPEDCSARDIFGPDPVRCFGDANITPLVPMEQYRDDYIFYVPTTYKYQYINVLAPLGTTLTIDGNAVSVPLDPIATVHDAGNTTDFGRAIVRIKSPGNHRIAGNKPFGIIGYGYASYTSYSYAGGLNLAQINPIPE